MTVFTCSSWTLVLYVLRLNPDSALDPYFSLCEYNFQTNLDMDLDWDCMEHLIWNWGKLFNVQINNRKWCEFYFIFFFYSVSSCLAVYLILGFLYQRLVVGAKGVEQFPNYGFWSELGNLSAVSQFFSLFFCLLCSWIHEYGISIMTVTSLIIKCVKNMEKWHETVNKLHTNYMLILLLIVFSTAHFSFFMDSSTCLIIYSAVYKYL